MWGRQSCLRARFPARPSRLKSRPERGPQPRLAAPQDGTGASINIAWGPVASQEAIKNLGTNGGGFFNANGAHPYENPTPLTNFIELFLILVIPAALTYTFGRMVRDTRQGWAILCAFMVMALAGVFVCYGFE